MAACVSGCALNARHKASCTENCRGCLPREASHGKLCARCHWLLEKSVRESPAVVDYLRAMVVPGTGTPQSRVAGTREQPSVLSLGPVDSADLLHARLAAWASLASEETGLTGPDLRGSRVRPPFFNTESTYKEEAVIGLRGPHHRTYTTQLFVGPLPENRPEYRRPEVVSSISPPTSAPTAVVAQWLLAHQEHVDAQDWACDMLKEISTLLAQLRTRYPKYEEDQNIPDVACPECERLGTLVYRPPTYPKAPIVVQCEHADCRHVIPEERWGLFVLGLDLVGARA